MSTVTAYPVTFEIYDAPGDHASLLARVNSFDEATAEVELHNNAHTAESWRELASEIHACLLKMVAVVE